MNRLWLHLHLLFLYSMSTLGGKYSCFPPGYYCIKSQRHTREQIVLPFHDEESAGFSTIDENQNRSFFRFMTRSQAASLLCLFLLFPCVMDPFAHPLALLYRVSANPITTRRRTTIVLFL
jgi:hypothetical protein